nr:MAG TPA: hypothetical protein [Caudoviricetes sp.]
MDGIAENLDAKKDEAPAIDSWEAAFAALEQRNKKEPEETSANRDGQPDAEGSREAEGTGGSDAEPVAEGQSDDAQLDGSDVGGGSAADGATGETVSEFDYSTEEVNETISSIESSIEDQAVSDVANAMKASGKIRVTRDGKLGASINDPDIYTKDEDGVPTYINPETGRPFTGDNPRAQAKQWVDDYNAELEQAFNKIAKQRIDELKKEKEPIVRTLKFAETYKKLNDVQRDMLDSLIEDYEVKDEDGNAIGYSCDLDKALAQVNRQISKLTERGKALHPKQEKPAPTEPALDMPQSTGSSENKPPQFKNLAEAMSWSQDQMLKKGRK